MVAFQAFGNDLNAPTSQWLLMGNGAESRHTVKYYPKGFGALLASPTYTNIVPMIIDTHARGNHSSTVPGAPPGRHGPVPPQANVGPEAMYSGIMECPCTDAFPKNIASAVTLDEGTCPGYTRVSSAAECFQTAASLGLTAKTNTTVNTETAPAGCYVSAISGGFEVAFNAHATSTQQCGLPPSGSAAAPRKVAMMQDGACTDCSLDVDLQPSAMPNSSDISGEWRIEGPLNPGTLVTVLRTGTTSWFTMLCNGPNCGQSFSNITSLPFVQHTMLPKSGFEMCFAIGSQHLWC